MARNIVKDYIDYDKKFLREYIDIITEKKLNTKICDMIIPSAQNVFDLSVKCNDLCVGSILKQDHILYDILEYRAFNYIPVRVPIGKPDQNYYF